MTTSSLQQHHHESFETELIGCLEFEDGSVVLAEDHEEDYQARDFIKVFLRPVDARKAGAI